MNTSSLSFISDNQKIALVNKIKNKPFPTPPKHNYKKIAAELKIKREKELKNIEKVMKDSLSGRFVYISARLIDRTLFINIFRDIEDPNSLEKYTYSLENNIKYTDCVIDALKTSFAKTLIKDNPVIIFRYVNEKVLKLKSLIKDEKWVYLSRAELPEFSFFNEADEISDKDKNLHSKKIISDYDYFLLSTDASGKPFSPGIGVSAVVHEKDEIEIVRQHFTSVNDAELFAILLAVKKYPKKRKVIMSDSQTAVKIFNNWIINDELCPKNFTSFKIMFDLNKNQKELTRVVWVPGHNDVFLNEIAHRISILAYRFKIDSFKKLRKNKLSANITKKIFLELKTADEIVRPKWSKIPINNCPEWIKLTSNL